MEFISRIISTLEVASWEKLPGTVCRVEHEGWDGKIIRIGHFMKDKWFDPRDLKEFER